MENLPSNVLDFKNNELNNNGASSNKGSSSNNSDSCSSGTSSRFSELFRCHLLLQVREKKPRTRLDDEFCEEPTHPHLFPTGEFGYKVEREIQISLSKYFNQRLLNYCQKSASDSDYIFCSFSSTEIAA